MAREVPSLSLRELSDAAASGERAVFDEVHRRLDVIVRRFMRERGADASLSDDLSQRVWFAVWQACRAGTYDPSRSAISTFVYAVSSNVWLQHLRSRGTRDARTQAIESLGVDITDAERATDFARTAEAVDFVRRALSPIQSDPAPEGLTERERAALRATGEDVTDRDLALRLGVSPSTAHTTRRTALEKLGTMLRRAGLWPGEPHARVRGIPPDSAERTPAARE
jgi:RNA polymerase sigma factor (sigma-70 family)